MQPIKGGGQALSDLLWDNSSAEAIDLSFGCLTSIFADANIVHVINRNRRWSIPGTLSPPVWRAGELTRHAFVRPEIWERWRNLSQALKHISSQEHWVFLAVVGCSWCICLTLISNQLITGRGNEDQLLNHKIFWCRHRVCQHCEKLFFSVCSHRIRILTQRVTLG